MKKCSCINCQFEDFLANQSNKDILYFEDEENFDNYCIFHAPLKIKEKFRISQKEVFKNIIDEYINYCMMKNVNKIDFKNVIFLDYDFRNKNLKEFDLDFTNAIFKKNIRFDNLKCKKLIFKDTLFLDGGAIKNRDKDKNLQIEELEFRPYSLESDFVIDLGSYVNRENSLVELDNQGIIKQIKFENHKVGEGKIFFIGLNQYAEKVDFRNMLLDKVYFQNCNLEKCYFLNSKIDKTEFRNCYFPQNQNRILNNEIVGKYKSRAFLFIAPLMIIFMYVFIEDFKERYIEEYSLYILSYIYLFMSIFYLIVFLASLNLWIEFISYVVERINSKIIEIRKNKQLDEYIKSFNVHFSIADEKRIYEKFNNLLEIKDFQTFESNKKILQISLDSLSSSYSQLKDNFKDKDFQISGDFFYSQRYTELLSQHKKDFWDLLIFNIHHFTNGFGEKYFRPLVWFIFTILLFSLPLIPNKDFISTSSTPLFLIKTVENDSNSDVITYKLDIDNDFKKVLIVNGYKDLCSESKELNLYGYDNRFNYHIKETIYFVF
jgi:uncharacterized protein YjbI with pentapeptide repeats